MNFIDRRISVNRAIAVLAKNGIEVDDGEAAVILDFLYLISQNRKKPQEAKNAGTLKRNRTLEKSCKTTVK
ncbi:PTS sugar transporter subunit IIBC [uncultured Flavobacterium sp.]|uniref:PTS sugar transporter subunit IIBC n=1 Tax=uncultured Flavobacterium sp. TaxID=165435 RepID=UPI0025CDEE7F|nr:PTS sugar transporter subunit IIBC [uncultured Flavobacterium sp.]